MSDERGPPPLRRFLFWYALWIAFVLGGAVLADSQGWIPTGNVEIPT